MDVFTTIEGGDLARFGRLTGKIRQEKTANMFSGTGVRILYEIEAFEIVHPDLAQCFPGMEVSDVPEWVSSRPCGIGKSLGLEWA